MFILFLILPHTNIDSYKSLKLVKNTHRTSILNLLHKQYVHVPLSKPTMSIYVLNRFRKKIDEHVFYKDKPDLKKCVV